MAGRKDKLVISGVIDNFEQARQTAIALVGNQENINYLDTFNFENLTDVENNIKRLNEYSDKCWLLSSILLYTLVYDKSMYKQSGLSWEEYIIDSKKRLNMDANSISEQLSGARFFIKHHKELVKAGWKPTGMARKLARAEYALELSGSVEDTISHIVSDSWAKFQEWYAGYKYVKPLPEPTKYKRDDIKINKKSGVFINGVKAYTLSDDLPEQDRVRFEKYINQIFVAIKDGYEPAIVPVYDEKEANNLLRLRDNYRAGK